MKAILAAVLCCGALAAQDASSLAAEPTAFSPVTSFTFNVRLASSWEKAEVAGQAYPLVYLAPQADRFRPNLNFVVERAQLDHASYVAACRNYTAQLLKVTQSEPQPLAMDLPTAQCSVMTFEQTQMGFALRQRSFCISLAGDLHVVVTQTALATDGDRHDALVQAAVSTFAPSAAVSP